MLQQQQLQQHHHHHDPFGGFFGFGGGAEFSAGNCESVERLEAEWSKMNPVLPEYAHALKTSCLQRAWFCRTKVQRYYRSMANDFAKDQGLPTLLTDESHYDALVLRLIQKGFGLTTEGQAMQHKDLVCDHGIFESFRRLYEQVGSKRAQLAYAVQIMLEMDRPEAISAKVSEVCDRAMRCYAAHHQALNVLVLHSYQLKHKITVGETSRLDTEHGALARFNEILEDYLDDHKENAFKSAFEEPARLCLKSLGDHMGADQVNIHGLNWYLALLHSALGVQLPLMPAYEDGGALGVVDFWAALNDFVWERFSDPRNFGTSYERIASLRNRDVTKRRVSSGEFPEGLRTPNPKDLGHVASGKSNEQRVHCKALALYLQRFAFFFSRDFFLRKAFEIMNSEVKVEHKGFTRACETLFKSYKEATGASEDSVLEHLYNEEYELDVERLHRFFAWLGVAQHDEVQPHFPIPEWPGTSSSDEPTASDQSKPPVPQPTPNAERLPEHVAEPDPKKVQEALHGLLHPAVPETAPNAGPLPERVAEPDPKKVREALHGLLHPAAQPAPKHAVDSDPAKVREALRGLLHSADSDVGNSTNVESAALGPTVVAGKSKLGSASPEQELIVPQQHGWLGQHLPFAPPPPRDEDDEELQAAIRASLEQQERDREMAAAIAASFKESDDGTGERYGRNSEPWVQEHTSLILRTLAEAAGLANPDDRACAFEPWAICELTHGAAACQVAKAVVENELFKRLLNEALRSRSEWVRDAAAIFFRLSGMYREGELAVSEAHGKSLAEAVELILEPSERNEPVLLPGQYYGALYTQAVTALLSARMSEQVLTNELQALAKRTGAAVVHSYEKHKRTPGLKEQIKERIREDYPDISATVWGSREADIVWQKLYA